MKKLLKTILPKPMVQQAVVIRDRMKLSLAPGQNFDESGLRPSLKTEDIKKFFNNEEVAAKWHEALNKITSIYIQTRPGGGVNPGDRRALYYLIHALRPQNFLEVGTHIGASTVFLAEAIKTSSPQGHLTTVDILDVNAPDAPWHQQNLAMSPRDYLIKFGTSDNVTFMAMPSKEFLRNTNEKYDFIFLDGDHSAHTVYEEVSLALKALAENGVILLHDYYPDAKPLFKDGNIIAGPFMALDRIMRENKAIKVLPLGDLPWETKQGLRVTSLALVTRAT